jgi:hypothetical protein
VSLYTRAISDNKLHHNATCVACCATYFAYSLLSRHFSEGPDYSSVLDERNGDSSKDCNGD